MRNINIIHAYFIYMNYFKKCVRLYTFSYSLMSPLYHFHCWKHSYSTKYVTLFTFCLSERKPR